MSRSNPNENLKHPAKLWIEYHGGGTKAETFTFWDKTATALDGSKGKEVSLGKKLRFMFLDQTYTVTGWNDASHSGVTANEVKDISNGVLSVKAFKSQNPPIVGPWTAIKDQAKSIGGKFTANIYVAVKTTQGLELAVVQLKGAAFAKWNEFKKSSGDAAIETGAVSIGSHLWGKKGAVDFCTPVFGLISEITAESDAAAIELDKVLQEYLTSKIAVPTTEAVPTTPPVQINEPAQTSIPKGPQGGGMGVVDMEDGAIGVPVFQQAPPVQEEPHFDDGDGIDDELPF